MGYPKPDSEGSIPEIIQRLENELRDTEARTLALKTAIRALQSVQEVTRPGTSVRGWATVGAPSIPPGATMVEAAVSVLREAAEPLHIREIMGRMRAGGFRYSGSDKALRSSLNPALDRRANDFFYKPSPGVYGLREWMGGRTEPEDEE